MSVIAVAGVDVVGIRADNPGPLTLTGTNSWVIGRDPAWLIDPGPSLPAHVAALTAELTARGGLGGITLTHAHPDHAEAVPELRERFPDAVTGDGQLEAMALPGHSLDHRVLIHGDVAFSGDAVLGEGSVFIAADPGALRAYLAGLEALARLPLRIIAPGHGPLVHDPAAKLAEYLSHRRAREARLLAALADGARSVDELLDAAWSEVAAELRFAAAITLAAHLDKLAEEGRLPDGVERPAWPPEGFPG
ncbi:MBL fold metallo-hydrolase [Conexibacter sp. DBS9H8]|uniref:MBL fold metallo-hydrolase n=1 Tax=Conexibacter sp. DBS9H8 TaxID=2937801 RepID=UPI00201089EA|nr:MBL fold metallo-hydrolase [Conexibacter sp. DBS9H8]